MEINRFKKIIEYSRSHQTQMEFQVRDFYEEAGMAADHRPLNLLQIVRPIFRKNDFLIIELPFADLEIGALCYKGDCLGYVFLNTSIPKVNGNFALCHEIFHVVSHQMDDGRRTWWYIDECYNDQEEELAANLFAGMLLMPEPMFSGMFNRFLRERDDEGEYLSILVKLMNYFQAPYMAVLIRCYERKLLEAGKILENLIKIDSRAIHREFIRFWLDEGILKATRRDDYSKFEELVRDIGEQYKKEGLVNERKTAMVLKNMAGLYQKIKGES